MLDGPRHLGQSLSVVSLDFACASALLGIFVHVGSPFAGSSSFLAQESRPVCFTVVSQIVASMSFSLIALFLCRARAALCSAIAVLVHVRKSAPCFLMGSLFGCLVPCFLVGSLSGWCFVWLDLLGSPEADGFSHSFQEAASRGLLLPFGYPITLLRRRVFGVWFARPQRQRALRRDLS